MLYHHTDHLSAAEIRRERVIRAAAMTLYSDLLMRGPSRQTPPVVWLTTKPEPDPTVLAKLAVAGWPPGSARRIEVPDPGGAMDLPAFARAAGLEMRWFGCMVATAAMAGGEWEHWRIVLGDVRLPPGPPGPRRKRRRRRSRQDRG